MAEATIVMVCGLSICEATIAYTSKWKFGNKVHMVFIYVYESHTLNKSVEKQKQTMSKTAHK